MVEERDEKRITLRIPTDVYEAIASAASERHLSINSYILQVLNNTEYLDNLEFRIAHVERQIAELARKRNQIE